MKIYVETSYRMIFTNDHGETLEYLTDANTQKRLELMHEMLCLYYKDQPANNDKVDLVKLVRTAFNMTLKEAMFVVNDAELTMRKF
jgi:ribosomal protein L7/L12